MINEYTELIWTAILDKSGTKKQELYQRFLRKCPTSLATRRLSRIEKNEINEWAPEMLNLFAAIKLRKIVTKSHEEIVDHAYSSIGLGCGMTDHFQSEEREGVCIVCANIHDEIIN